MPLWGRGAGSPSARSEAYLHAKFHLDLSNCRPKSNTSAIAHTNVDVVNCQLWKSCMWQNVLESGTPSYKVVWNGSPPVWFMDGGLWGGAPKS